MDEISEICENSQYSVERIIEISENSENPVSEMNQNEPK